ncbi:RDD family protein [Seongchinamella sediminis]|uniref:RDD family protein n=1 Tax=Seongchinamella sediminis TaxID=2283635 RepID=A0A3L7E273_9GAMM|nr:RDD family protein [Seongchinamella sediminis]RLQ22371.1 RDD family protein [Seongchinamella sediminis]
MEEQEYAGFWIRVAAALIDTLLLVIVCVIPLTLIYGAAYWTDQTAVKGFWDILLQYILPAVATVWFWVKFMGTPGKLALRLRVVDANTGQAISTPKAIGRYLGYYVSILPLMLGIIWVGIDKRKQGFHDKLAGTVVVRQTGKETVRFGEQ